MAIRDGLYTGKWALGISGGTQNFNALKADSGHSFLRTWDRKAASVIGWALGASLG